MCNCKHCSDWRLSKTKAVGSFFTVDIPKSFRLLSRPTLGYWLAVFQFLKLAKLVENDRQEWCDENNA